MKLRFSSGLSFDQKALRQTALFALAFFFAAHAFCFFNLTFSGASVMLDVSKIRSAQFESGSFLAPYYFRLRGTLSAPLWVGMLCALYLTATAAVCAHLLRIKRAMQRFVLCGALTANAALTSVFAASLHTADASALALLLAALAAAGCLRLRFGFFPGAALLFAAMALDPGSLAFFAALALIAWLGDLLSGAARRALAASALGVLLSMAAGALIWWIGGTLMAGRNGVGFGIAAHMPQQGLIGAFLAPLRALGAPLTAYPTLSVLLRVLLALSCVVLLIAQVKTLGKERLFAAIAAVLLFPVFCSLPLFYQPAAAQITSAYCLLDVLLLVLLIRLAPESGRIAGVSAAAFGILFLGSIVFSNQVYLKKNLEFESTLSLTSRIIQRAEETEGYRPGYTPVAIIGTPQDSVFSVERKGFEHLSALDAAKANYAVTSEEEMIWYCWEVLGYPCNFVSTFEREQLKAREEVAAMPVFPAEGCCAMLDGVLVIRLN